jgi:hypothetical protein
LFVVRRSRLWHEHRVYNRRLHRAAASISACTQLYVSEVDPLSDPLFGPGILQPEKRACRSRCIIKASGNATLLLFRLDTACLLSAASTIAVAGQAGRLDHLAPPACSVVHRRGLSSPVHRSRPVSTCARWTTLQIARIVRLLRRIGVVLVTTGRAGLVGFPHRHCPRRRRIRARTMSTPTMLARSSIGRS